MRNLVRKTRLLIWLAFISLLVIAGGLFAFFYFNPFANNDYGGDDKEHEKVLSLNFGEVEFVNVNAFTFKTTTTTLKDDLNDAVASPNDKVEINLQIKLTGTSTSAYYLVCLGEYNLFSNDLKYIFKSNNKIYTTDGVNLKYINDKGELVNSSEIDSKIIGKISLGENEFINFNQVIDKSISQDTLNNISNYSCTICVASGDMTETEAYNEIIKSLTATTFSASWKNAVTNFQDFSSVGFYKKTECSSNLTKNESLTLAYDNLIEAGNINKGRIDIYTNEDSKQLAFVSEFEIFAPVNCTSLFENLLATTLTFDNFKTSDATDFTKMFKGCQNLTSLDLSGFDTSKVINMSGLFKDCKKLQSLNLTSFNTSEVVNMKSMFDTCSALKSLDLSSFNTSEVVNMKSMFDTCSALKSLDLSNFSTIKVSDMSFMFNCCSTLETLNLSTFNTSAVTNMSSMFQMCAKLSNLNLTGWNVGKVINMSNMFYYCKSLVGLDLASFSTNKVTNMRAMFSGCTELTSLNIKNLSTENVTSMAYMFYGCANLTSLDLSNFNTSKVTDWECMLCYTFQNTSTPAELKISSNFVIDGVVATKESLTNKVSFDNNVTLIVKSN